MLALGHAVVAYLRRVPWLAKDVVWLLPDSRCGLLGSSQVGLLMPLSLTSYKSLATSSNPPLTLPIACVDGSLSMTRTMFRCDGVKWLLKDVQCTVSRTFSSAIASLLGWLPMQLRTCCAGMDGGVPRPSA